MLRRRVWTGVVALHNRAAALLGLKTLDDFIDHTLANLGGGGGGSDPSCPPCVGPASYTYDAGGRLTTVEYGAPVQVTMTITRNGAGQITQTEHVWAAGTRTCTFTYDGNGRRTDSSCAFVAA